MPYLTEDQLARALTLADLTDPAYGPHCMQQLVAGATGALRERWGCPVLVHRANRVVPVADNYDALGYPPDGPARESRYTRYVDAGRLLRSQTSAIVPSALRTLAPTAPGDVLVCAPGLVYRRDAIDRLHVGEPHQLDLWRITERPMARLDLEAMIAAVVEALLPGAQWRALPASHPYTEDGREVEVLAGGEWVELLECGLAHPRVLAAGGLGGHSGLAMGIGLDRAVMLRKGIGDIRLLRSDDPRVAAPDARPRGLSRGLGAAAGAARHEHRLRARPHRRGPRRPRPRRAERRAGRVGRGGRRRARTPAAELPPSARERIGIADDRRTCSCAWSCATRRGRWPRRRPTRCATASTRRCTRGPSGRVGGGGRPR